jgi:hypothetical protein
VTDPSASVMPPTRPSPTEEATTLTQGPFVLAAVVVVQVTPAASRKLVEVHLVEAVGLVGGFFVVEAPEYSVRQNAPLRACVLHVEVDLVPRILVGQRAKLQDTLS